MTINSAIQFRSAILSPRSRRNSICSLRGWGSVIVLALANVCALKASAQEYNWLSWTAGTQSATATLPAFGTLSVSTTAGGTTVATPFPITFNSVPFSPIIAPTAAVRNFLQQSWMFTIDFTLVPDSRKLFLGIGNFGYGGPTLPGYRLAAFDSQGASMSLSSVEQLGSYDHTWTESGLQFNDNVLLNRTTGDFTVTRVDGLEELDSDMLLLTLPAGIRRLEISTIAPASGDTINIVVAPREICVADFNDDGTLDFFDYLDFVDAFSSNSSGADFNNDSIIDFFDYLDFVDAFSVGC